MSQTRGNSLALGEGSERVTDKAIRTENIRVARAVADTVRSTLGPKGMDKMIVTSVGLITITNDGVTILNEMAFEHPTAEIIVDAAENQEAEAGDGTSTTVLLIGSLLGKAEALLEQDIHPSVIMRGYNLASERTTIEMKKIVEPVDPTDESLFALAETSMTGKGREFNKKQIAEMVVNAVRKVTKKTAGGDYSVDLDSIKVQKIRGQDVSNSKLYNGAIIDNEMAHDSMPKTVETANILLADAVIGPSDTEADTTVTVDNAAQLTKFMEEEEDEVKQIIRKIVDSKADVVFCQQEISEIAGFYLAKEGILAVERTSDWDLSFMSEILDTPIISDIQNISPNKLGKASVRWDPKEELFYIDLPSADVQGVTVLLCGSSLNVVDELERVVDNGIKVVSQAILDGRVLPGGGGTEVAIAARLRNYAEEIESREQLAINAFADALEDIPRNLAENAGLDPIDSLVNLRVAHDSGNHHAGLNALTGEVTDTFESGIIEPAHAKSHAIASAIEATNLLLKIDGVISAQDLSSTDESVFQP